MAELHDDDAELKKLRLNDFDAEVGLATDGKQADKYEFSLHVKPADLATAARGYGTQLALAG